MDEAEAGGDDAFDAERVERVERVAGVVVRTAGLAAGPPGTTDEPVTRRRKCKRKQSKKGGLASNPRHATQTTGDHPTRQDMDA